MTWTKVKPPAPNWSENPERQAAAIARVERFKQAVVAARGGWITPDRTFHSRASAGSYSAHLRIRLRDRYRLDATSRTLQEKQGNKWVWRVALRLVDPSEYVIPRKRGE